MHVRTHGDRPIRRMHGPAVGRESYVPSCLNVLALPAPSSPPFQKDNAIKHAREDTVDKEIINSVIVMTFICVVRC